MEHERVSSRSVLHYLKGLDLPADKKAIIHCAQDNDAPKEVLDALQRIPEPQYRGMDDVLRALGEAV